MSRAEAKSKAKTNIILANLNSNTLTKVLELCSNEKILYTFDEQQFERRFYCFHKVIDELVLKNNKIPIVYKEIIEGEYKNFVTEWYDSKKREIILEKLENIEYEN